MKRILLSVLILFAISTAMVAQTNHSAEEIHWITSIDELQMKMAQQPKKVLIDFYTGWCGWCKKMDAATYTNPSLVKYVNNNFYAVKFDAERQDTIRFQGKNYFFAPQYKANGFALELLKGQMSYPHTVFMTENFQQPTPVPGYRTVKEMEAMLTYFGDNMFRRQPWAQYEKTYVSRWDKGETPAPAGAVQGH